MNPLHTSRPILARGFSLTELMIAMALGLLILAGLSTIFVSTTRSRGEIEKAGEQIENGRYAMQSISQDLRNAGYYAEFDPRALSTPSTKPDACDTSLTGLKSALPLHVQGYDGGFTLSCLSDRRAGSDILVVRRASTCVAGAANCTAANDGPPHFQASLCNNSSELASTAADLSTSQYALNTALSGLTRHKKDCTTLADIHRYRVHIYYVANNDVSGDGIPTLKRAELGADGFSAVPVAEGIENLQVEYGIDTNADGAPDAYTADPDTYGGCSGSACQDNWRKVVAAKIFVLARNTTATSGHTDGKSYVLGRNADGSDNSVGPYGDHYKRHAFQAVVRLNNPAGRGSTP